MNNLIYTLFILVAVVFGVYAATVFAEASHADIRAAVYQLQSK